MERERPDWYYRRDPWDWATWEGARLAGLLTARDLSFDERIRQVEELARRAEALRGSVARADAQREKEPPPSSR